MTRLGGLGLTLLLAGAGGLLTSLWLPWYRLHDVILVSPQARDLLPQESYFSAWHQFAWIDILLVAVAVAALVLAGATMVGRPPPRRWALPATLMLANGVALVLYRMAHAPEIGVVPAAQTYKVAVSYGSLAALISASAIVIGSWLAAEGPR
jgi:hypothetical protein